jgi:hypothetical protein
VREQEKSMRETTKKVWVKKKWIQARKILFHRQK